MNEESIFTAAIEKTSPEERAKFLEEACGGDAGVRAGVEALLHAHDRPDSFLEPTPPVLDETINLLYSAESPGAIVAGRYKLLEEIGEGGMGTVWVAEQTQPVRRKVALKLIKTGMDSKSVLARFEAERQALAVMDHPNIAKVLDGGLTETGRPFFVMEYVKGVPITEYCEAARLGIPERLQLFVQVCQAVQHAHQKGIIHRDLKPSNILVAPYDDRAIPKVIDFGLAKAMNRSLTERTLHTAHDTVLGTPSYMSPEQAQLNNLDVDTRSDLYSLGVLLYELLTGTTPLEKQRFKEAAWDEVRRIIREEEPQRPSMRLTSSQALPSLAAGRQMEPAQLTKLVRGELDWIVMKALEKDRTRRYETANGFAVDIQRYLTGEPVLAAPPSARYRLRKFAGKHRAALTTAGTMILLLLAGAAFSTWQAVRALRAEAVARTAEQEAEARRAEAERQKSRAEAGEKLAGERLAQVAAEKKKAEEEKQIAKSVEDFLQIKLLGQADTREQADALLRAGGSAAEAKINPTIRELLDRAAQELSPERIGANFPNQPLVQAEILQTVGRTYCGVGENELAIGFLERSTALYRQHFGPYDPKTLDSMSCLAWAYQNAGKLDLALPLGEETLKLCKAKLGLDHPVTLMSMNNLAGAYLEAGKLDQALPLFEETLKLRKAKLGAEHPDTLMSMNNLAGAYKAARKLDQALPLFEETLKLSKAKLGLDHPDTLLSINNLARAYRAAGKPDQALPLFEEALKLRKAKLGLDHPDLLWSMNNLAWAYKAARKLDQALPLFEETLKLSKAKLGLDHPTTLISMNNLARAYQAAGKPDQALPLFEQTLKLRKAKLGPEHPDTLTSMNNLAEAFQDAGKLDRALPLFEQTLKLRKAKLGAEHPDTLTSMNNLASAHLKAGKLDLALPLFEETLRLRSATLGPEHPDTLMSMNDLAAAYWKVNKLDKSIPMFEDTLKRQATKLGRQDADTLWTAANLGVNYRDAGRFAEALPLLEEAYRAAREHPSLRWVSEELLDGYVQAGKVPQAAALAKVLLADARGQMPRESPQLAARLAATALLLIQAKSFTEAEPLLRECLAIRAKTQPDEWTTFNTKSLLGGALSGQEKYAEAEPLLLSGYEGMKQREAKIPSPGNVRLTEALERLVQLYDATEKKAEAAKWRKELEGRKETQLRLNVDKPHPETRPGAQSK